ncbi:MAG: methylated-DNA--[protein]-cysteine S-methyltransferase [bacterium]
MRKKKTYSQLYQKIWEIVARIPKGYVATYSEVAADAGIPQMPRVVGYALNKLPPELRVPWHRVVNARGMIAFPKPTNEYKMQKALLISEGINFRSDKINLLKFSWYKKQQRLLEMEK